MNPIVVSFFAAFLVTALLIPSAANAQDASVAKSMQALKDQTAELGAPKIEGKEAVGGKDVPALYFGSTKMNNNPVVDKVAKEGGEGMAATLFVKGGATNISALQRLCRERLEANWAARPSTRSTQVNHSTARHRLWAYRASPAMSRSKTHRAQSLAFTPLATKRRLLRWLQKVIRLFCKARAAKVYAGVRNVDGL